jgi:hypothetical protein
MDEEAVWWSNVAIYMEAQKRWVGGTMIEAEVCGGKGLKSRINGPTIIRGCGGVSHIKG